MVNNHTQPAFWLTVLILFILSNMLFAAPLYDTAAARKVVNSLEISKFKGYIKTLSDFGGRTTGTQSNTNARLWLQKKLDSLGYKSALQSTYNNVYCTKTGSIRPDSMYIVGGHYDGMAVATASDDNASGSALVIEAARAFASPLIKTRYSIRFIIFNNEETGLEGSKAYVTERKSQQGKENPAGSKIYPEPVWRGMVMHDMILYDHGMPPQAEQIAGADIDIEYQATSQAATKSLAFANEFAAGCKAYSPNYPSQIGNNMSNTDSDPFKDATAAISVRELQRISEIGKFANPNWHTATDRYATYSEKDFLLGFNTVQMTVGTLCMLAGVYDSVVTSINAPQTHYSLLPAVAQEIKVFTVQGRKIQETATPCEWQPYSRNLINQKTLNNGLYIMQITFPDNTKVSRYFRVMK